MLHKCEKRTPARMYGLQDVLLRTSIVLGMVAAVVTILYFTPTPGKRKIDLTFAFHHKTLKQEIRIFVMNKNLQSSSHCYNECKI